MSTICCKGIPTRLCTNNCGTYICQSSGHGQCLEGMCPQCYWTIYNKNQEIKRQELKQIKILHNEIKEKNKEIKRLEKKQGRNIYRSILPDTNKLCIKGCGKTLINSSPIENICNLCYSKIIETKTEKLKQNQEKNRLRLTHSLRHFCKNIS